MTSRTIGVYGRWAIVTSRSGSSLGMGVLQHELRECFGLRPLGGLPSGVSRAPRHEVMRAALLGVKQDLADVRELALAGDAAIPAGGGVAWRPEHRRLGR